MPCFWSRGTNHRGLQEQHPPDHPKYFCIRITTELLFSLFSKRTFILLICTGNINSVLVLLWFLITTKEQLAQKGTWILSPLGCLLAPFSGTLTTYLDSINITCKKINKKLCCHASYIYCIMKHRRQYLTNWTKKDTYKLNNYRKGIKKRIWSFEQLICH